MAIFISFFVTMMETHELLLHNPQSLKVLCARCIQQTITDVDQHGKPSLLDNHDLEYLSERKVSIPLEDISKY